MIMEWFQRDKQHALDWKKWPLAIRWPGYFAILAIILVFGNFGSSEFIYFQF